VTSQLNRSGGAREHIEKELTLNESLKSHQKNVFETAIAFIDQLSQGPATNVEEEVWNLKVSTDFSKSELVQTVLASRPIFSAFASSLMLITTRPAIRREQKQARHAALPA
jgi:hypothetical protein